MRSRKNIGTFGDPGIYLHRFEALAAIALASLLVWFALALSYGGRQPFTPQCSAGPSSLTIPAVTRTTFFGAGRELYGSRPLYPYSVIPGGIQSADELRKAVVDDPVVAAHYAGFDFDHAHVVRLAEARSAFVSYRRSNLVYWTSKRLSLPAGETVITDGMHTSRTRCGNQISDVPRTPTAPVDEPNPDALTTPILTEEVEQPPIDLPLEPPPVTGYLPLRGGGGAGGTGGTSAIPPFVPVSLGSGGGETPPASNPPTSAPVVTPEPGTLLLISTGLCATWFARKLSKS